MVTSGEDLRERESVSAEALTPNTRFPQAATTFALDDLLELCSNLLAPSLRTLYERTR